MRARHICFLLVLFLGYACASRSIQNVHLALAGPIQNNIVVSWLTNSETSTSTVMYGLRSGSYNMTATGNQTSYMVTAGWNHNVKLSGLQAGTTYFYVCGDDKYAWSPEFNFTTPTDGVSTFTFGLYGDMGIDNSNYTLATLLKFTEEEKFSWIYHLGDISYANDHPLKYEDTWNEWFSEMEPIMAHIPYMVCPGNHEKWSRNPLNAIQTSNFTTYKEKFRMPGEECGTDTNMFYSFDYMNVHFVSLSTESDYPGHPYDPSPAELAQEEEEYYYQVNWLQQDLAQANANRENVPWIIVVGHRAIYAPNEQKNGVPDGTAANLQQWLEPVFKQYNVDLYLVGHVHAYARTWPVYNNQPTQSNYTYPTSYVEVVSGAAGNREGHSTFPTDEPSWYAEGNDTDYGFGTVTVWNNTHVTWNWYISETGELADTFTLIKDNTGNHSL